MVAISYVVASLKKQQTNWLVAYLAPLHRSSLVLLAWFFASFFL
jgi:hypothetical protein